MTTTREYAFDVVLRAAIRVKATSEAEAREMMHDVLDCADANFGSWPDGSPVLGEASLDTDAEGQGLSLYEVDGEPVGDTPASIPAEELIAEGSRFEIYENRHGFRLVRLSDGAEATFYGDDNCERFRDHFFGDEAPDAPEENADAADATGDWAEAEQELPPVGPRHPLPVGTRLTTVKGAEQGDWDTDESVDPPVERRTRPGEAGKIIYADKGRDGWIYGVVFDECGAWVNLEQAEIDNPSQYIVIA